jgi:H/ACA ribonucleoprotein complex subunit 3
MVWLLRKCITCNTYTLNQFKCPKCEGKIKIPHPAKFSMDDRYRTYKLRMKRLAKKEI